MEEYSVEALSALSDEALVAVMREQPQADSVLILRYRQLVLRIASDYAASAADAEDYVQEGLIGLLTAVSAYDPDRAASFRTFAAVCIRNRIRNAVRAAHPSDRPVGLSLDDPDIGAESLLADDEESPEQLYLTKERVTELYRELTDVLSRQEREVICLAAGGFSYREIAGRLHISEKSVDNAVQRGRRKLRAVRSRGEES
ncbi:MAG: sigma-70 family RNA polymerase sigma factor [Oscillospiraceae bacterium]|nr:sigma-70 family RNA polymerase sigma factor [Oscillospiraceae bacterium]